MKAEKEKEGEGVGQTGEAKASGGVGEASHVEELRDDVALPALARSAVETFVRQRRSLEPPTAPDSSILWRPAACFVSIKTLDGDLRGCIGTVEPTEATLAGELIANAVSAATRDPRFPPVTEAELGGLRYSVDVLFTPEPARFEDLDPTTFGVIVEDEGGRRRGLLLPDIAGIESARQQVEIAARKAGITPGTSLKLQRFRVRRFREPARASERQADFSQTTNKETIT